MTDVSEWITQYTVHLNVSCNLFRYTRLHNLGPKFTCWSRTTRSTSSHNAVSFDKQIEMRVRGRSCPLPAREAKGRNETSTAVSSRLFPTCSQSLLLVTFFPSGCRRSWEGMIRNFLSSLPSSSVHSAAGLVYLSIKYARGERSNISVHNIPAVYSVSFENKM